MAMMYRSVGASDLKASIIGMGCEGFNKGDFDEGVRLIEAALDGGVNLFDMYAPSPQTRAKLAKACKDRRNQVLIQGHLCSVFKNGEYARTRAIEEVEQGFETMLQELETDYLDIGMIHYIDWEKDFKAIFEGPIAEYAVKLKEQGRVRALGFSAHNPVMAKRAVETGIFDTVMFSVNPAFDMMPPSESIMPLFDKENWKAGFMGFDPERVEFYELCESKGVGITVMKGFGAGDLLKEELSPLGVALTPVQCIHYALERPGVCSFLGGYASVQELQTALSYLDATPEERDYTKALASMTKHSVKGRCLYCGHCAPCSGGIDIATVTKLLAICQAQGEVPETVREHYASLERHADNCMYCSRCEARCPFKVDIRGNMRAARQLFGM